MSSLCHLLALPLLFLTLPLLFVLLLLIVSLFLPVGFPFLISLLLPVDSPLPLLISFLPLLLLLLLPFRGSYVVCLPPWLHRKRRWARSHHFGKGWVGSFCLLLSLGGSIQQRRIEVVVISICCRCRCGLLVSVIVIEVIAWVVVARSASIG